jgi:hypothetical protein
VVVQVRLIEVVVRSGETAVSPDAPNCCDEAVAEAHYQYRRKNWMTSAQLFEPDRMVIRQPYTVAAGEQRRKEKHNESMDNR